MLSQHPKCFELWRRVFRLPFTLCFYWSLTFLFFGVVLVLSTFIGILVWKLRNTVLQALRCLEFVNHGQRSRIAAGDHESLPPFADPWTMLYETGGVKHYLLIKDESQDMVFKDSQTQLLLVLVFNMGNMSLFLYPHATTHSLSLSLCDMISLIIVLTAILHIDLLC